MFTDPPEEEKVIATYTLFGNDIVLIPVKPGNKNPIPKGWQTISYEDSQKDDYQEALHGNNFAILTGSASNGLISVDLDTDEAEAEFRIANPDLTAGTLRTKGDRGCNFWLKIEGEYPEGVSKITTNGGKPVGELRAGNGITVVQGTHPSGKTYTNNNRHPELICFDEIQWPEHWDCPWIKDPFDVLVERQGEPYTTSKGGAVVLNEPWFVERFEMEHKMIFEPGLGAYYEYDELSGKWEKVTVATVRTRFSNDIKFAADHFSEPKILGKRTRTLLSSLDSQLKGHIERPAFFDLGANSLLRENVIHVQNGMLHVTGATAELRPFHPDYRSLNQIDIAYDPLATCEKFQTELLDHALSHDDQSLLQKYCGQLLLGRNLTQTILILEGKGGSGKGTIAEIIDGVVGETNIAELRTQHLESRFEIGSYYGKTLIAGRDVPGRFLNFANASALKKLTGGDLLSAEAKGANDRMHLRGEFNIIVTTNTRLIVNIDGDKSAWKRRLNLISFDRDRPSRPVPHFSAILLREGGAGILNWMVEGAKLLLQDIDATGVLETTPCQTRRVNDLLNESDSVSMFVSKCVTKHANGATATYELFGDYKEFCAGEGFDPVTENQFQRQLAPEMLETHGIRVSDNVHCRAGERKKGYKGVRVSMPHTPRSKPF